MTAPSPDDLPGLVEAVAEAIHQVFVPGSDSLGDDEDRELARAAVAAMVEHLGLVEEGAGYGGDFLLRRLVSRWTEVEP